MPRNDPFIPSFLFGLGSTFTAAFALLVLALFLASPAARAETFEPIKPGKHMLSLQWLDGKYGTAEVSAPDAQGVYRIKGEMRGKEGFVTIDGTLTQPTRNELVFTGLIRSQVSHLFEGKICEREGTYHFRASGKRKFWRLQEMDNCEGSGVVDYIDIHF